MGRAQAVDERGLGQDPSQEALGPAYSMAASTKLDRASPGAALEDTSKERTEPAPEPPKVDPAPQGQPSLASPYNQSAQGQSLPLACKQPSRLNYNRRAHTAHTRIHLDT